MIRVIKMEKMIPSKTWDKISKKVGDNVWRVMRIKFHVPYNVFRVRVDLDGSTLMDAVVDKSVEDIDLTNIERGKLPTAYGNVTFYIYNKTSDEYKFVATLMVDTGEVGS